MAQKAVEAKLKEIQQVTWTSIVFFFSLFVSGVFFFPVLFEVLFLFLVVYLVFFFFFCVFVFLDVLFVLKSGSGTTRRIRDRVFFSMFLGLEGLILVILRMAIFSC